MAITSVSGVSSGLLQPIFIQKNSNNTTNQGGYELVTAWYATGYPPAATAYTGGLAGQTLSHNYAANPPTPVGSIPFPNPPSGQNTYIGRFNRLSVPVSTTLPNQLLIDRLWENSGLDRTLTTAQTVNSVAWPARDINQSTNGEGVYIALEVSTSIGGGSTAPAVTMSYTNSAGTSGRTGTIMTTRQNAFQGQFMPFMLDSGDIGVRSVQSVTFSLSWGTSGVLNLVAFRPLVICDNTNNPTRAGLEDAITTAMPRIYDSSVLQTVTAGFFMPDAQALEIQFTQG